MTGGEQKSSSTSHFDFFCSTTISYPDQLKGNIPSHQEPER